MQKGKAVDIMANKPAMSAGELSKAFESQGMKVSEEKAQTVAKEIKVEGKVNQISDNSYALKEKDPMPVKPKIDVMGKGNKPGMEAEAKKFANANKLRPKDPTTALVKVEVSPV